MRTVLASPVGTATENGDALLTALNGITSVSSTNPHLLKIEPGIYDIGTNSLQMKEYVDVEGSGENTTLITGHIDSLTSGVVQGASNAEIRFLTVQNTGEGGTNVVAIHNPSASLKITNVTASASGGINTWGIYNGGPSSTMTNVTASASGAYGSNHGVYNVNSLSSSPTMTNVTASASGCCLNYGVFNLESSPTMTNVTASASKGQSNWGVHNGPSSFPLTLQIVRE